MTKAKTPAHQGLWQRHCDKGNDTSLTMAMLPLQQRQQHYCNYGKDAWTAKTPVHWRRQQHCNEDDNTSSMTAKTPAHWWWQQPYCYKGNGASLMTMLAQLQQRCHHNKGNNCRHDNGKVACASTATTPLLWGQQHHRNDGKDACASMMTTMPLQWGKNASLRMATMPSQQGQNCCHGSRVTRATTPVISIWWQGCLPSNDGNNTIVMRATIAIATRVKTLHINGNNAIKTRAMMPDWWLTTMATTLAQQRRRHACCCTRSYIWYCIVGFRGEGYPWYVWSCTLMSDESWSRTYLLGVLNRSTPYISIGTRFNKSSNSDASLNQSLASFLCRILTYLDYLCMNTSLEKEGLIPLTLDTGPAHSIKRVLSRGS